MFVGKPDCFIVSFPQTFYSITWKYLIETKFNLFPKIFVLFVLVCNFTRKFASVYCFPCSIVLIYDFVLSNYLFIFLDGVSTPAETPPSIEPTLFSPDFTPGIEKVSIVPTLIFFHPRHRKIGLDLGRSRNHSACGCQLWVLSLLFLGFDHKIQLVSL
jgi:hypothetical protein